MKYLCTKLPNFKYNFLHAMANSEIWFVFKQLNKIWFIFSFFSARIFTNKTTTKASGQKEPSSGGGIGASTTAVDAAAVPVVNEEDKAGGD